jgi:hypothetical protein
MLVIDARSGRVASVDPWHVHLPTVAHGPWRAPDDAHAWLRRLRMDERDLVGVLATELERHRLMDPGGGATATAVMSASARALASARIRAATRIDLAAMSIRFHDDDPEADLSEDAWLRGGGGLDFQTRVAAEMFVNDLDKHPENAAEIARAVGHRSNAPWQASSLFPGGSADLVALLYHGVLTLGPMTSDLQSWRIAWPRKRAAGAVSSGDYAPAPPAGRQAPSLPPPAPKGPASSLPEDSDSDSDQAAALIAAALAGAPFCEECARAAAKEAETA